MLSLIITLLIFSILVVVHEFGHFIAARRNGILVEEFAVGMGPLIYGKKVNGTMYSIRLFPIGGYCKMLGEPGEEESFDARAFNSKTVTQRISVCLAGVLMNFLLAVVLAALVTGFTIYTTTEISEVMDGLPAQAAGLLPGDRILKIDKTNIYTYDYLQYFQAKNGGEEVTITYERQGERNTISLTPEIVTDKNGISAYKYGIIMAAKAGIFYSGDSRFIRSDILSIAKEGFFRACYYVKIVVDSLKQLISFNVGVEDLAGPIRIGQIVNESIENTTKETVGLTTLWLTDMTTLLSANLAVMNLLPIPALDGGRILFLILEGIRKRPVDPEKEGIVHFIGFALVIILAVFVAYNDIARIIFR